ncbi:inositol polyphosphate multikinase [Lates japonicus]
MWPGCIYAAVQDMKIIESALLREPCFTTGHSGGNDSAAGQRGCCRWLKTATTTEASVLVSSGLDHFHEGFSTSRPNNLLNLCAGLYSLLM